MERCQGVVSPSTLLLCEENKAILDEDKEMNNEYDFNDDDDDDDDVEYIGMLLDREVTTSCAQEMSQNYGGGGDEWIERARLDGIQYILTKRESLGYRYQTAYLAVTYLDRFLSRRSIDKEKCWAIRLLAITCFSLAAKMEECTVPALSEMCLEDYSFECNVIQRMELLVLNTLEWKMGSITPFAFVHFFMKSFGVKSTLISGLSSRIVDVVLCAMRDANIMCHRPSVIAAAATLVALDQGLAIDALQFKIGSLTSSGALKIEDIISCYYQVQQLDFEKSKLEKGIKSPELSPIQQHRGESSSVTSVGNAKRKRLEFNQLGDDDDDDKPDKEQKH